MATADQSGSLVAAGNELPGRKRRDFRVVAEQDGQNDKFMADQVLTQRAWVNEENKNEEEKEKRLTPFERLNHELSTDERYMKEVTLGKRIGFYRIRGELGSGNFCQVKMGIHALSKGEYKV